MPSKILALAALLLPVVAEAQIVDPPVSSLQLILSAHRQTFLLGEPIYVTATLRNGSDAVIPVLGNLDPQVGALELFISADGTERQLFSPTAIADVGGPLIDLGPGSEITATVPMFFGARGWTFPPGVYSVTATYDDNFAGAVQSNEIQFSVSDDDAAPGAFLVSGSSGVDAGKFLLWRGGDHLTAGIERLNSLIATHPTSPLVDYARFALGVSRSRSFMNYIRKELRKPDCPAATDHLGQVNTERFPAYLIALKQTAEADCSDGNAPAETTLSADPAIVEVTLDERPLPVVRVLLKFGATLRRVDDHQPLSGMQIGFSAGTFQCAATTDARGFATCGGPIEQVNAVLSLGYSATFAGTDTLQAVSAEGPLAEVAGTALP